jgi:hypothetical protein
MFCFVSVSGSLRVPTIRIAWAARSACDWGDGACAIDAKSEAWGSVCSEAICVCVGECKVEHRACDAVEVRANSIWARNELQIRAQLSLLHKGRHNTHEHCFEMELLPLCKQCALD